MEDPKSEVEELKRLVAGRGSRHYSPELKARVIAYAERRYNEGASAKNVSDELGVNVHTLGFWRERKANAKALLRPVRVIDETSDVSVTVQIDVVRNSKTDVAGFWVTSPG